MVACLMPPDFHFPLVVNRSMGSARLYTGTVEESRQTLPAIFAGEAMLLSLVGIYGVMSYTFTQSSREIAIRMALGAQERDALKPGIALRYE